jgi:hypothetical protein
LGGRRVDAGGLPIDPARTGMKIIAAIGVLLAVFAAGFFGRDLVGSDKAEFKSTFPDAALSASSLSNLGCTAVMAGSAYEDRLDGSANARAGRVPEKLALNLSDDSKTLSLLYAYDVGNGMTDPVKLDVHSKTDRYLVAHGKQILGETAVILDLKSGKGVVSYTGQGMLGIKGSSLLVECR